MGNGSSVDPCKTVYVEINGKKEKVCIKCSLCMSICMSAVCCGYNVIFNFVKYIGLQESPEKTFRTIRSENFFNPVNTYITGLYLCKTT